MAGRGTDIMLGGNSEFLAKEAMRKNKVSPELIEEANTYYETDNQDIIKTREQFNKLVKKFDEEIEDEKKKVISAGGLKILGTERHESRRIDNQLRGRSGRQGDIGESKFYIGLDDDLMKIFGGDAITKVYNTLGADENMPIDSRMISKAVENAQRKVESRNFSIRKNVLKYDDVMNAQREIIYKQRRQVLDGENIYDSITNMIESVAENIVNIFIEGEEATLNVESLNTEIINIFGIDMLDSIKANKANPEIVLEEIKKKANEIYSTKEEEVGSDQMRELERIVMLKVVDEKWMNHIDSMDELKNGIGLRAYGQKDPVVQYRLEGFDMFDEMIEDIKIDVTKILMHIRQQADAKRQETAKITGAALEAIHSVDGGAKIGTDVDRTVRNEGPKVGRNDPCPCGSGKKYKNCHGKNE
jgi:preprotein translocase subunit SecA